MSEINDGYGDLSEVERILAEEDEAYRSNAARFAREYNDLEDAHQEARIEAWQSLESEEDRGLRLFRVKQRMTQHSVRDQWFGTQHPNHGTSGRDPLRRTDRYSFDHPDFGDVVSAFDVLDEVMKGYHHGEIMLVLNAMTPRHREYVYCRFWLGESNIEIAARMDVDQKAVSAMWCDRIKPKLVARLEHLVGS